MTKEMRGMLLALGLSEEEIESFTLTLEEAALDALLFGVSMVRWQDGKLTKVDPTEAWPIE